MKRKVRIFTSLIALALFASMLAGCDSSSKSSTSSKNSVSSSSSASTSSDPGPSSEAEPSSEVESSTNSSSETESDTEASGTGTSASDVIGKVTAVTDSGFDIAVYEADTEIADYTDLSGATLSDTGSIDTVTIEADAVFEHVSSGVLETTTQSFVMEGDMIAVTQSEDGTQRFIILEYTDGEGTAVSSAV